jgi:hypothetical protein
MLNVIQHLTLNIQHSRPKEKDLHEGGPLSQDHQEISDPALRARLRSSAMEVEEEQRDARAEAVVVTHVPYCEERVEAGQSAARCLAAVRRRCARRRCGR